VMDATLQLEVEGSFESSEPRVLAIQDMLEELVCGKRDRKPGVCQYLRWNGLQGPSDRAWGAARWLAGQRQCAAPSHLWEGWQQGKFVLIRTRCVDQYRGTKSARMGMAPLQWEGGYPVACVAECAVSTQR
jgi:hypothetical protein